MKKKSIVYVCLILIAIFQNIFATEYIVISGGEDSKINSVSGVLDTTKPLKGNFYISTENPLVLTDKTYYVVVAQNSKVRVENDIFQIISGRLFFSPVNKTENSEIKLSVNTRGVYTLNGSFIVVSKEDVAYIGASSVVGVYKEGDIGIEYQIEEGEYSFIATSLSPPQKYEMEVKDEILSLKDILYKVKESYEQTLIRRYSIPLFVGTDYETSVFRVVHKKSGTNIFILAPHANEEGAPIVAKNACDFTISSGSLTIMYAPDMPAYKKKYRYRVEDLNRQFYLDPKDNEKETYVDEIAIEIMNMLDKYEIDVVIALHESRALYRDNKNNFGMTIVYDGERLTPNVEKVLSKINPRIKQERYKMLANLKPMPSTFTYYAYHKGFDAYSIEMESKMRLEIKTAIQTAVLEELLKLYGVY